MQAPTGDRMRQAEALELYRLIERFLRQLHETRDALLEAIAAPKGPAGRR